jgi:hypothetical protein
MQRLWAYQESVIAKSARFATKKGLLEVTETVREAVRNSTQFLRIHNLGEMAAETKA